MLDRYTIYIYIGCLIVAFFVLLENKVPRNPMVYHHFPHNIYKIWVPTIKTKQSQYHNHNELLIDIFPHGIIFHDISHFKSICDVNIYGPNIDHLTQVTDFHQLGVVLLLVYVSERPQKNRSFWAGPMVISMISPN